MHEERRTKKKEADVVPDGAVPTYLLDREGQSRAKVLSNMIKQKRKEKAVSSVLSQGFYPLWKSRKPLKKFPLKYSEITFRRLQR